MKHSTIGTITTQLQCSYLWKCTTQRFINQWHCILKYYLTGDLFAPLHSPVSFLEIFTNPPLCFLEKSLDHLNESFPTHSTILYLIPFCSDIHVTSVCVLTSLPYSPPPISLIHVPFLINSLMLQMLLHPHVSEPFLMPYGMLSTTWYLFLSFSSNWWQSG